MKEIPLCVPNLNTEIIENLRECIETGWVSTSGRFISEFEEKFANYINVKNAVACQSGTAGLHTALRILGVGSGDEVIVPTLTFIGAVNPVKYVGAYPVFMDCDDTLCMDAKKLTKFCEEECDFSNSVLINKSSGRVIKAIIPVHVFGNLADMEALSEIAYRYKIKVIEDATEALGSFWDAGRYKGRHAGTVGDIGVFSFNANKIITTGGGGMIVAKSQNILDEARYLTSTAKDDSLYFVHNEVGYNYRMLNIQAALGVSQIGELPSFIETKIKNYKLYKSLLGGITGLSLLPFREETKANHWFYSLLIGGGADSSNSSARDYLLNELIKKRIQCRPIWRLIHKQAPYADSQTYIINNAEFYETRILNLPCSTNLKEADINYICENITDFYQERL